MHLSGRQAGETASRAGVGRLMLTHVPPWTDPLVVLAEARGEFDGEVLLAEQGRATRSDQPASAAHALPDGRRAAVADQVDPYVTATALASTAIETRMVITLQNRDEDCASTWIVGAAVVRAALCSSSSSRLCTPGATGC